MNWSLGKHALVNGDSLSGTSDLKGVIKQFIKQPVHESELVAVQCPVLVWRAASETHEKEILMRCKDQLLGFT
ncbi:unnamed protein product [Sphenostylis stenocarpa]|uniref:Uncharacterized protein n=1 Tax=Sphenostylis stenocarpa TaxID=92480 RepID=A0AA86T5D8_9FABA|nr:unnamed protein product [Sphenostylis stenocarpa]